MSVSSPDARVTFAPDSSRHGPCFRRPAAFWRPVSALVVPATVLAALLVSSASAQSPGPAPRQPVVEEAPRPLAPPRPLIPRLETPDTPALTRPAPDESRPESPFPSPPFPSPPSAADPGADSQVLTEGIMVGRLQAPDPGSVGLLESHQGGIGLRGWDGVGMPAALRLLPHLPETVTSPTLHVLMRRLLLSAAFPPDAAGFAPEPEPSLGFLAARVDRLVAIGAIEEARALLALVPQRLEDTGLEAWRRNLALLDHDHAEACALTRNSPALAADPGWRRALIFCQVLEGQDAAALLGADLMREQGLEEATFSALLRRLTGHEDAALPDVLRLDPLTLAMMRAARVPLPPLDEAVSSDLPGPVLHRVVARSPNAALETRLDAALQAHAASALSTEALVRILAAVPFEAEEIRQALRLAETLPYPRRMALLFQAARQEEVAAARAELMALALQGETAEMPDQAAQDQTAQDQTAREQAEEDRAVRQPVALFEDGGVRRIQALRLFAPLIETVQPAADLGWFAADAVSALLLGGRPDAARAWHEVAPVKEESSAGWALWPVTTLLALSRAEPEPRPEPEPAAGGDGSPTEGAGFGLPGPLSAEVILIAPPTPRAVPGLDPEAFAAWWRARFEQGAAAGSEAGPRTDLFFALYEGLGGKVPKDLSLAAALPVPDAKGDTAPAPRLPAAWLSAVAGFGEEEQQGGTLLLTGLLLGGPAPDAIPPYALRPVLGALVEAGFVEEARALAVEIALAARL